VPARLPSHRPRKALGQHFLRDPRLLDRIVTALDPGRDDVVLEIGAGEGTLTARLVGRVGRVVAIEKDRALALECGTRNAEWGSDKLTVVTGDALRLDWHALLADGPVAPRSASPVPRSPFRIPHWKVVGNIPYAITTPLIAKALTPPWPERIVFLVQAEVAARLAAQPGTRAYGALSVGVQAVCEVERLFAVRAGAFFPPPRVASAVVRLVPRAEPLVRPAEVDALRAFVTACFARRRKQLRNAVAAAWRCTPAAAATALATQGLDPAARPETLAPAAFVALLRAGGGL